MRKRRLTEIFPFLLPIRKWQRELFFYIKMFFDENKYARSKGEEKLKFKVFETKSLMINKNSGFDIKYQINKVDNLKLASKTINRLIIRPNEVFSFWQLVRHADKYESYKKGLNLVNGKIMGTYGGGLCQLSNVLYWVFLHTPLTTIERHSHAVQNFVPSDDSPLGIDATISEGWKDLKVKNETESNFQILISFDEEFIYCSIFTDTQTDISYEIYNSDIQYYRQDGNIIQRALVNRREVSKTNGLKKDLLLYINQSKIDYCLDERIKILEKGEV